MFGSFLSNNKLCDKCDVTKPKLGEVAKCGHAICPECVSRCANTQQKPKIMYSNLSKEGDLKLVCPIDNCGAIIYDSDLETLLPTD